LVRQRKKISIDHRFMPDKTEFIQDFDFITSNSFKSEKDMCQFVFRKIEPFIADYYSDKVISKKKESKIFYSGGKIDIFVEGKRQNYIIECKNHRDGVVRSSGIDQLLAYGVEFFNAKKPHKLILIDNCLFFSISEAIHCYNLPIDYYFVDRTRFCCVITSEKK